MSTWRVQWHSTPRTYWRHGFWAGSRRWRTLGNLRTGRHCAGFHWWHLGSPQWKVSDAYDHVNFQLKLFPKIFQLPVSWTKDMETAGYTCTPQQGAGTPIVSEAIHELEVHNDNQPPWLPDGGWSPSSYTFQCLSYKWLQFFDWTPWYPHSGDLH